MDNCIFCKIVAGEIPSVKIWEDDEFVAILDAFPNRRGHTLVISKRHFDPDLFLLDDEVYSRYMLAVKNVVALLKKGLQVERIGIVVEGLEAPHAHVKLYPFYEGKGFADGLASGPKADTAQLEAVAKEIESTI